MPVAIECAGAPRDLGLDQGQACRETLREACARVPLRERWPLPQGAAGARVLRDLERHFPHLSEAFAGIAAGAGVPARWLLRRLAAELAADATRVLASAPGGLALLALECDGPLIARRSRPDGGFACLEIARPWSAAALAGVNEAGLAVAAAGAPGAAGRCAAPAALLAQDCLQRFGKLENALDWCCARPAGYTAALLLADAHGELAGIEIRADARRVLRPEAALLSWADGASAGAELAKALRDAAPGEARALARLLAPSPRAVVLDPAARRLAIVATTSPPSAPDWLALEPA